jgi:hypothetical protein
VKHKGKKWNLNGKSDYTVWYGDIDDVAVNVVIVEAKGEGKGTTGLPQTLGYMGKSLETREKYPCLISFWDPGTVHRRRKLLGKTDCTVYGVCCDDVYFLF